MHLTVVHLVLKIFSPYDHTAIFLVRTCLNTPIFFIFSILHQSPKESRDECNWFKRSKRTRKRTAVLLVLDVVQANHTNRFSYIQQEINLLAEEYEHISTIDTISLFTDEERDQLLSTLLDVCSRTHKMFQGGRFA